MQTPLHILLAMDDSESALKAAALVARNFHSGSRVTLFHVKTDTVARLLGDKPALGPRPGRLSAIEEKRRVQVAGALERARRVLLDAGFTADRVATQSVPRKMGVARDILSEARTGYDLIVLGRRGPGSVKDYFSGSVSARVFTYARDIALLIVP